MFIANYFFIYIKSGTIKFFITFNDFILLRKTDDLSVHLTVFEHEKRRDSRSHPRPP